MSSVRFWCQRMMRRNGIQLPYLIAGVVLVTFFFYFISRITAISGIANYDISTVPRGVDHTDLKTYKTHASQGRGRRIGMFQVDGANPVMDRLKSQLDRGRGLLDKISNITGLGGNLDPRKLSEIQFNMDQFNISAGAIASLMGNVSYLRHISRMVKSTGDSISSFYNPSSQCRCSTGANSESECRCCANANLTVINLNRSICVVLKYRPKASQLHVNILYDGVLVSQQTSTIESSTQTARVCSRATNEEATFPLQLCALLTNIDYDEVKKGHIKLQGCLRIGAKVHDRYLAVYPVGCFGQAEVTASPAIASVTRREGIVTNLIN